MPHAKKTLAIILSTLALTACDLDAIDIDDSVETSDPITTAPEPGTPLLKEQIAEIDYDEDGTVDRTSIRSFTYDANGNLITESRDGGELSDADGTPDAIDTYTYDKQGNQLTLSKDYNGDGTADYIENFAYDDNGHLLNITSDFYRSDGTVITNFATTSYDAEGNLDRKSFDFGNDGTIDDIESYTYDDNGNVLSLYQGNNDGSINPLYTYTYDEKGNQLTESYDDGGFFYTITFTYDDNGNQTSAFVDYNGYQPNESVAYTNTYY